jgi:NADH dehydrogenase [ubiquinone] 1 alpha subcomplex assembly factor 6
MDAREAAERCAAAVRAGDRERYLADLFAPPGARAALFALHAFNLEVARIPEIVSEPLLGRIRLQWWRESLDGIYGGAPRRHDVVLALDDAVKTHAIPRGALDALLDAREQDMAEDPLPDMAALVAYARATSGGLARAAMVACGGDAAAQEAAAAAGTAQALAGLLRAVPFHASQRRVYLPQDALAAEGLRAGDVVEGRDRPALMKVCRVVAAEAGSHLAKARVKVARDRRAALLPAALAALGLRRLARAEHDPYAIREPGPLVVQMRLALAHRTGRF